MAERDLIFFSYRHDEQGAFWLGRVLDFLKPFRLGHALTAWSDLDIRTGDLWNTRIQGAIERCRVGVLLVNHNFFGSDYICQHELPRLLRDAHAGLLRLVPVLIGPCPDLLLNQHGLDAFQFTHPLHKPLRATTGVRREQALSQVAVQIHEAFGGAAAAQPVGLQRPAGPASAVPAVAVAAVASPGALLDVPAMDLRHFVARPDDLAALRGRLLRGEAHALGLTAAAAGVGLHGMGGMGKSVLAQALCHDDQVRHAFPDGIAWVALGQQPDILSQQNRLLRLFAPGVPPADRSDTAQRALQDALHDKRVLLVVDDIWDARHFGAFDVLGAQSRMLLTTRDAAVLAQAGAQPHELQRLPAAAARALLATWSGQDAEALGADADAVIAETGALPLALALAGAQAAGGLAWATLARELRQGRLRFLDHPYGSVFASLGRSVDHLPAADRDRYLELAVFPEDVAVPAATVHRLWAMAGLEPAEGERLLGRLARSALLSVEGAGPTQRVSLHDLQHDFVRARSDDPGALHGRLLDAHRAAWALPAGPQGWARMPREEPYLWHRLAAHLHAAGRQEELEAALLDLDVLQARLASLTHGEPPRADVSALVADCALAREGSAAQVVGRALQRSAHVLAAAPEQLGLQLFGRLGRESDALLQALAQQGVHEAAAQAWVPTLPALQPLGGQLAVLGDQDCLDALLLPDGRRALSWGMGGTLYLWDLEQHGTLKALAGHEGRVFGALLPDGHRALSWGRDGTLRLWDLEQPGTHQTLTGHEGGVSGALLLPDGRRALSWGDDRTLRLWDMEQPGKHQTLTGHEDRILGALLLPDGRRALSWGYDRTLRLWDLEQPGTHQTLTGHAGVVLDALLLPDGHRALSWESDGSLRLWDLGQPGTHQTLTGHEGWVSGALLLPDGRRALSCGYDGTLRLWDLEQPGTHQTLTGHQGRVRGALLLSDGRRALSWGDDRTLHLWDLQQPGTRQTLTGHEGRVNGALLLPDGRRALSWGSDDTLRLWDLEQPGTHQTLTGHDDGVFGALLLPDGRRALSWGYGTLRLWDLERRGTHQTRTGHAGVVLDALLLPNSHRALSWGSDGSLRLWDLGQRGTHQTLTGHEGWITGALLLPDGRRALSWGSDGTLRLWDLEQPGTHQTLTGHDDGVFGALLLPNGHCALSWGHDGTLRLWNLERPGTHQTLTGHEGRILGALLLPDGRRALSWGDDRTLRLWGLEQPGAHQTLTGHKDRVLGALLLPDGRRALSWGDDRTLRLWGLEQPGTHQTLTGHEGRVSGALLLSDGRRALSWGDDRTLHLWDLQYGTHQTLTGHEDQIRGALLLPDGRCALSWGYDGSLRLWDLEKPGTHRTLAGHAGGVRGALLLPDGRRTVSWANDRTLRLWDLPTHSSIASYQADAIPTAALVTPDGQTIFVGDALGFIQILRITTPGP